MPRQKSKVPMLHKASGRWYFRYDGKPVYFGTKKNEAFERWIQYEIDRRTRTILDPSRLAHEHGGYSVRPDGSVVVTLTLVKGRKEFT